MLCCAFPDADSVVDVICTENRFWKRELGLTARLPEQNATERGTERETVWTGGMVSKRDGH